MGKGIKVTISVCAIPHSNPKAAIDLVAKIVTRQLAEQEQEQTKKVS